MPVRSDRGVSSSPGRTLSPTDDCTERDRFIAVRRHHTAALDRRASPGHRSGSGAASSVRGLFVDTGSLELAEGEYLDAALVGLRIVDEGGTLLGTVGHMHHYPAQDCIVLAEGGALIPDGSGVSVRKIDVAAGEITVSLPPGLLDQSAAEEA